MPVILGIKPKKEGIFTMPDFQKAVVEMYREKYPPKKLFNTEQAAEYLNLKKQTLYNWRHERKGPDYTMIGRPMYELSELDRFIESKRVKLNA